MVLLGCRTWSCERARQRRCLAKEERVLGKSDELARVAGEVGGRGGWRTFLGGFARVVLYWFVASVGCVCVSLGAVM